MTVQQLIDNLSTIQDKDSIVVMTNGYEGGLNGIDNNTPAIQYVALDVNEEWYYGTHERVDDMYDATNSNYHIVKAIIL